ncbi:ankyrin repeat protein [Diaporthe helianthi]|uniref:Ankyrin repeat protein n=1 Tax=Diaporthe helianthi TaxID=158607 RepID=A0A2P5HGI0_DIAHE|nr:ankyrin repeat protein [Diaporthe helianthi]
MPPNPFLLAADNPTALLALLHEIPSLASQQDDHGYSLLHAAASYNHLDVLRALVTDFNVPVDLRDEDSETALFVVETVEAARLLVEELGLDAALTGDEGLTAREKIEQDGDFPAVAEYLAGKEDAAAARDGAAQVRVNGMSPSGSLPLAPRGLSVNFGTVSEGEVEGASPDPGFRRRIEELASREDLNTESGQAALRQLVEDAVSGEDLAQERNVRPRQG